MKNRKNKIILSSILGSFGLVSSIGVATICSSCSSTLVRGIVGTIWVDMDNDGNDDYIITEYTDGTYLFNELLNKSLENFEFPNLNITAIYNGAFMYCNKLTSITIPDTVEDIMFRAFGGCEKLLSIVLPDKLTKIEERAFVGCFLLNNITLPSSLTYIGKNAFSSITNGIYTPLPKLIITVPNETIKQLVINSGFDDESRIIVKSDN
ncbi:MAG: leucine-rich repeat domain-containing protein [Ureaplasma sp.]|nr:leucine-rich repeat domain-containing protein [Ureaplasma sp.]MDE6289545.1 leucine-rich repeat domain-containing protein [Ureaplasma sp.]